jgi:hypothetical protein
MGTTRISCLDGGMHLTTHPQEDDEGATSRAEKGGIASISAMDPASSIVREGSSGELVGSEAKAGGFSAKVPEQKVNIFTPVNGVTTSESREWGISPSRRRTLARSGAGIRRPSTPTTQQKTSSPSTNDVTHSIGMREPDPERGPDLPSATNPVMKSTTLDETVPRHLDWLLDGMRTFFYSDFDFSILAPRGFWFSSLKIV